MKYISILVQHHPGPTGDVLICKNKNGKWEFPSAKQCSTETPSDAAVRVASEQLGMAVKPGKLIMIGHKNINDGYTEHIACGNITHNTNSKEIYHEYYEAVNTLSLIHICHCGHGSLIVGDHARHKYVVRIFLDYIFDVQRRIL